MSRLVLFTAGASLLENLRNPEKLNKREVYDGLRLGALSGSAWSILGDSAFVRARLIRCAEEFIALNLESNSSLQKSTAEIASYFRLCEGQESRVDDRLVLLCSDTVEGAFAALVNALLLGTQEILCCQPSGYSDIPDSEARVRVLYAGEMQDKPFHSTLRAIQRPKIEIQVVRELYPANKKSFEQQAVANLAQAVANLHYGKKDPQQRTILNYTGGFKAAIPTLTFIAAVIRDMQMVALYEQSPHLVYQQIIPIVLSPDVQDRLRDAGKGGPRDVLKDMDNAADLTKKGWDSWEKTAFYDATKGAVTLTPLGLALQQLLVSKASADARSSDL